MRLTSGIANAKNIVVSAQANAGLQRPGGKPRPLALCCAKGQRHATALAFQIRLNGFTRAKSRRLAAHGLQRIGTNAASQSSQATISHHHAAIAAGKRQHRQQPFGKLGIGKVGLEGQQVARLAAAAPGVSAGRQRLPRAIGGNQHRRLQAGALA